MTPLPRATYFPALLVAVDGSGVHQIDTSRDRLVVSVAHPEVAYRLVDGTIVVHTGDALVNQALHNELSRWDADGRHLDYPQYRDSRLLGIGRVAGHDNYILDGPQSSGTEGTPLTLYDVVTGSTRSLGFGSELDSGTVRASIGGGVLVQSETLDMGQGVGYTNLDGSAARGWPDLGKGLPYPSSDLTSVVVSPGGSRLAYLDGPPMIKSGPDPRVPWQLVIVDRAGHERLRLDLTTLADFPTYLDYDGRWAIISLPGQPPIIVDTARTRPRAERLPVPVGIVTLDHAH